ncbi:mitochondrial fission ELM1 family protein [Pelagibacteraceae bacterium]|jgi:mitochondrial fission protein ELM1|nr:mitochondrial fission ELM1 family protein [Pelagibacteraceae bacterium]
MSKLKALLLTQGMHGMISQSEGLAKALNLDYKHQTIKLKKFWNYIPPKFTPITENILSENFICNAKVIISCGRKSVIPSIILKKKFGKDILNIHIQDPKVELSNFDFIIAPEHDGLSGENVLTSKGAIHYLTNKELDDNENYLKPKINNKKKIVTLIIGGPTKHYDYKDTTIENIFLKIKKNFLEKNYQLILVPSMRTPQHTIDIAKNYFNEDQIIIPNVDKKAYLCSLKKADHIIVTCDSTSMISEAAITGKPIYVAQMPAIKNNERFKSFFNLFISLNIIKELGTQVENWTYTKLDETNKIADQIREKIKLHGFS